MKQCIALLLLLLPLPALAAAGLADVADDDPNLFIVMMAMLLALVCMTLAGLLIFAVFVGIIVLLMAMGIFSVSVISGWYHRSFAKGVSTFFRLSLVAMGIVGSGLLLLVLDIFHVPLVSSLSFCVLVVIAGGVAGWVCFNVIERLGSLLIDRLARRV